MTHDELINRALEIKKRTEKDADGGLTEATEFLRVYAGQSSAFFKQLASEEHTMNFTYMKIRVHSTLDAFIHYVQSGLLEGVSVERKAQIDVVSDFLDQAQNMLHTTSVHPAASCMVIGAVLEEFLRNWVEEAGLSIVGKPGIDAYKAALRKANLITKQDEKDINSWGGLRNYAAHGDWKEVEDKKRIEIMLEHINLFMRKYS